MNRHSLIVMFLGLPLACSPTTREYVQWEQILEAKPGKSILKIALDKSHVYYFEDSESGWPYESLWRISKEGGTPELLAADQYRPRLLTVDHTQIYWADGDDDRPAFVFALNKQGGTPQVLASGQDEVVGLAFDDEYVYWSENETGRVHRARKDGSGGPSIFLEIPDRLLHGLAVYDGALYLNTSDYNCWDDPSQVIRAPLDAPHASQTVASFNCALEFAVGENGVFILDGELFHPISLLRAPLLGGSIEVIYEQPQGRTLSNLLLDRDGVLFEQSDSLWRWTPASGAHLVGPPVLELWGGRVAADEHALYRPFLGISRVFREDLPL